MRLRITSTKIVYSGIDTNVIFLSESGNKELAVYVPTRSKKRINRVEPTWSPNGVLKDRIDAAVKSISEATTWIQAKNHAPAKHLDRLLKLFRTGTLTLSVSNNLVTVHVENTIPDMDKSNLLNIIKALFESFDVNELTRELRGFSSINNVEVKTMDNNPENTVQSDWAQQLDQATSVVNNLLTKFTNFDQNKTTVDEDGQLCVTLKGFGSISTILKEDIDSDEPFQQIQVYTDRKEVMNSLAGLNQSALSEALNAVIKHAAKKAKLEWDASITSFVDVYKIGDNKEAPKTTGREASIREMTHRPEVRFKLPVTPVIYNYTNVQVEIENTRVVPYTNGVRLQEMQHEGDPVIGVILDFSHPISGLHDLNSVRTKNPNIAVFILWNSEEGPVLELYND